MKKKTKDQWSEAEKACVDYHKAKLLEYVPSGMLQIESIGKQLLADLEPEIKPVFPDSGFRIAADGLTERNYTIYDSSICNTFYTQEEALEERHRLTSQREVREKINIANKGDNKFKLYKTNYYLEYSFRYIRIDIEKHDEYQCLLPWEYIRTRGVAEELLKDKDFVKDWLIMKGIKK